MSDTGLAAGSNFSRRKPAVVAMPRPGRGRTRSLVRADRQLLFSPSSFGFVEILKILL
jgi:hypothetical protein